MPSIVVRILGPTTVVVDGADIDPGDRAARVLASLAIKAGERVPTDRLIDQTWGEAAPPRARASLQMHIAKLRKLLAATHVEIETVPSGYRLVAPLGTTDAVVFSRLLEDAGVAKSDARWRTAADRSARALALWRGDRIETLEDVPSLSGEVAGLIESRRRARLLHAEALLALGDHEMVLGELEEHIAAEPFVERFWELLMLGLYRSGRQNEALAAYRRVATVLGEEVGIEPGPALARLEEQVLMQDPGLLAPPASIHERSVLPEATTPLFGRDTDIDRVVKHVKSSRLVTLLGPGGVGKTSLALAAGRLLAGETTDGGLFIDLTSCNRDEEVGTTALQQLGLNSHDRPLEAVTEHLRSRSLVVIIDNCEHVVEGVSRLISTLMESCPDLVIIATSRIRLDPTWSTEMLSPLAVPPPGIQPLDPADYPAILLFLERARVARPGTDVKPSEMATVSDICRTLDGLPLALVLVASWANVLTISDIAERLGDARLLEARRQPEGDRHGRLDDAIDWSYQLLSSADRIAFGRLAVFRSTFDLEAASAVLGRDEDQALSALAGLVDASLVVSDVTGRNARFRMLETIREFGLRRLAARDDLEEVQDRYRRHVIAAAKSAAMSLDEATSFEHLHQMLPDLRVVLDWASSHEPEVVATLAERLRGFWTQRGLTGEIEPRLESVVEVVDSAAAWYTLGVMRYARGAFDGALTAMETGLDARCERRDRARITNAMGVIALERGDYETAADLYRRAERLFSEAGHDGGVAAARLNQGIADLNLGRYRQATDHLESARALFHRQNDVREEAHALLRLAFLADLENRSGVAVERARAALRIARGLGPGLALADALQYSADFEVGAGNTQVARRLLSEAVEQFVFLRHPPGLQRAMLTATAIAVANQHWAEAAEMSAYATAIQDMLGIPVPAANRAAVERLTGLIAGSVSSARLDAFAERARLADADEMALRCLDVLETGPPSQDVGDHVRTTSE